MNDDDINFDPELQQDAPTGNMVTATPKSVPKLKHYINEISWNCIDNTVTLEIGETSNFSTFIWLQNINVVRDFMMKTAFVGDMEKEVLTLEFSNNSKKLIATIVLQGLALVEHKCIVGRDRYGPVTHNVVIKYDELEIICEKSYVKKLNKKS